MAKNAHLTLSDRIAIEVGLRERRSFASIAQELGKFVNNRPAILQISAYSDIIYHVKLYLREVCP